MNQEASIRVGRMGGKGPANVSVNIWVEEYPGLATLVHAAARAVAVVPARASWVKLSCPYWAVGFETGH